MWKQFIIDFLRFPRAERNAVLVLLVLIAVVSALPYAWPRQTPPNNGLQELAWFKHQVAQLNGNEQVAGSNPGEAGLTGRRPAASLQGAGPNALFYFDPNRTTANQWMQLGLRDRTIRNIQQFLAKGGRFRNAADLGKIPGLHTDEIEKLLPWVLITGNPGAVRGDTSLLNTSAGGR